MKHVDERRGLLARASHHWLAVIDRLWRRGAPGDARIVALLLTRLPDLGTPAFLRPPADLERAGFRLHCVLEDHEIDLVIRDLLEGLYWLRGVSRADIRAAIVASTAVVAARDASGHLVAFARAVSDGSRCAWIYDVAVAPHLRSGGLGSALMKVLLDHPAVRNVRNIRLTTRDAMTFYRRLGFLLLEEAPRHPWPSIEMIRPRAVPTSERAREPEAARAAPEDRHEPGLA